MSDAKTAAAKALELYFCGIHMKNPVTVASGTFGSGREYSEFFDLSCLGAVTVKGVSAVPWMGNASPRIAETEAGMLNSVGLQNPGAKAFIEQDIPFLRGFDTKIIVNICGHSVPEYVEVAEMLSEADIDLMELNISCPNIACGGLAFGTDPKAAYEVVSAVKAVCKKPLIVKLSPNVTDITEIARAAEAGGADALSLINTLLGMKIDVRAKKAVLANKIGGYSGPGVRPVAVRMVWQVAKNTKLPIIGMGGVCDLESALEFIMAGATMVAVGTGSFTEPYTAARLVDALEEYVEKEGLSSLSEIRGII
ncbi:MAG: dihydroorotate dehydrogenase [Firmicutes bacterium]|nr:dihydroorotate dehydrogenase [Bacillota bacterium]